jgi:uncharacterized pyridoxamine 5'-phosphate oxidase family protein
MIKQLVFAIIALLPAQGRSQNFGGNKAGLKWKQVNTAKVNVIFPVGLDSQANRIANMVTMLGTTTSPTIGGLQRKWKIVLQNQTTIPNAYVRMAPVISELYMTPGQDNFTVGSLRWDDNLIIHEERHIQQFSNFNKGVSKLFSFFLGQEGELLATGIFLNNYFFEGDAVWQETLVSKQGRGRMPAFYNGFKSLWLDNKDYKWIKIRSGSYKDFVPDHYPLGYMMVAYGIEKYGEDFWNKVTDDALKLRGFNKGIKRYSGKHFLQFYRDAMEFFKGQTVQQDKKEFKPGLVTKIQKNNVVDYQFPVFVNNDTVLVSKQSYREPAAFYLLANGREQKLTAKDFTIDDYFSYRNGKIVYAAYQSDPRWGNRDFSVIKFFDIYTGQRKQLGFQTKYFSPDINAAGSEIIAVSANTDGTNNLVRLNSNDGKLILSLPNPNNYFFTQTKYFNNRFAVSAIRNPEGKMALAQVEIDNGATQLLTPFSYNVLGYPLVKGDTVFFTAMHMHSDKTFALLLSTKKIYLLTDNDNGVYHPAVSNNGKLLVSAFTSGGFMLASMQLDNAKWKEVTQNEFTELPDLYTPSSLQKNTGAGMLANLPVTANKITPYKKAAHLFNFHSWRPFAEDPEYGYTFYSDNVMSSFSNSLYYKFNHTDNSHTIGFSGSYAGWYPVLSLLAEHSFNRSVDTAIGKPLQFNSAKLQGTISLPLSFVGGRTNKFINLGLGYNIEPFLYKGLGKNVLKNKAIDYVNTYFSFTNQSRQARQNIYPHWAQSIALTYRDAFTFRNSHKLVGNASFYFPGIAVNHSLVFNVSYQKRDSLPDLFSKTFSYSRGFEALSTRRMYKIGVNYHLPLFYPDWGFANLVFIQRIRGNAFYDYTNAKARVNGVLTEILNRSTGGEIYFDTRVWNALPVSIGIRYAHLLDTDLSFPSARNKWEIVLPIGLIPD